MEEGCIEGAEWPVVMESSCESLFMCIITTLKEGVRAGGGISDVLRKPASHVSYRPVAATSDRTVEPLYCGHLGDLVKCPV